jgi:hypothetical protein
MLPFLQRLESANRVLVAGCGSGFDVFAGVPIALHLAERGKSVVFANLSLANLWLCGGESLTLVAWRVDEHANELPYFPEKWLAEWLVRRGMRVPIYALGKSGARPIADAYRAIIARHEIDQVVLVDGGTDSIQFGDEPGLGTAVEDAVAIVAGDSAANGQALVAVIGFGVDHHHGVSHHAFLENVARLTREGAFLGVVSLTRGSPETEAFLDLVDYANQRQPQHRSIVCNSIASAVRGEFGNVHGTDRTAGSELFINQLMTQYWCFEAHRIVANMAYAPELARSERFEDARRVITEVRETLELRPRRPLPL